MVRLVTSTLLLIAALAILSTAHAQTLSLDSEYGGSGTVTPTTGFSYFAFDTAVDRKDRPVLVARTGIQPTRKLALARTLPGGETDISFSGGIVDLTLPSIDPTARVAIDDHDQIVLAGSYYVDGGTRQPYVARIREDGVPDPALGSTGIRPLDLGFSAEVTALAIEGNRVYLGLHSLPNGNCFVAALTTNGTLDSTFGSDGLALVKLDGERCISQDLLQTQDGVVLLGGITTEPQLTSFVAAFRRNGSAQVGFGTEGLYTFADNARELRATTLAEWKQHLVVSGTYARDVEEGLFAFVLTRGGTIDDSFNDGTGTYEAPLPGQPNGARIGLAVADDALVVSTSVRESQYVHSLFATVFDSAGSRVTQNGPDGFYRDLRTQDTFRVYTYATAGSASDSEGRVIVGAWQTLSGSSFNGGRVSRLLLSDGTPTNSERGPERLAPLALAPNPASGTAWVELDAAATVSVRDALGREVARVEGSGRLAVPTDGLAPGIYSVIVDGAGGHQSARLTVVR